MRNTIKLLITIFVISISSLAVSKNYSNHKSLVLTTSPMEHELALKVIPIVRTYISSSGHIAHVEGSNQIVILAKPETQRILSELFSSLDLQSFDKNKFKIKLKDSLGDKRLASMTTQTIHLSGIDAYTVIPALRALISKEGQLLLINSGQIIEVTDYPIYTNEIIKLIKQLDSPKVL